MMMPLVDKIDSWRKNPPAPRIQIHLDDCGVRFSKWLRVFRYQQFCARRAATLQPESDTFTLLAFRVSEEFPRWMQIQRARRTLRGHNWYSGRNFKGKLDDALVDRKSEIGYWYQSALCSRVKPVVKLISLVDFCLAFAPLLSDPPISYDSAAKR
jgi:hypothetical protein